MAAAHVEHVVGNVGCGDEVGDHGERIGAGRARNFRDVLRARQGGRRGRVGIQAGDAGGDLGRLLHPGNGQLEMQNRLSAGVDGEDLGQRGEAGVDGGEGVVAERHGGKGEAAIGSGVRGLDGGRARCLEGDGRAGEWPVLGIVHHTLDTPEQRGVGRGGGEE